MLVEVFLKLLICIVDIELFKVVNLRMGIQRVSSSGPSRVHRKGTGGKREERATEKNTHGCFKDCVKEQLPEGSHRGHCRRTSKFSNPKMSRMPMDLKSSLPLIRLLIFLIIHSKQRA